MTGPINSFSEVKVYVTNHHLITKDRLSICPPRLSGLPYKSDSLQPCCWSKKKFVDSNWWRRPSYSEDSITFMGIVRSATRWQLEGSLSRAALKIDAMWANLQFSGIVTQLGEFDNSTTNVLAKIEAASFFMAEWTTFGEMSTFWCSSIWYSKYELIFTSESPPELQAMLFVGRGF